MGHLPEFIRLTDRDFINPGAIAFTHAVVKARGAVDLRVVFAAFSNQVDAHGALVATNEYMDLPIDSEPARRIIAYLSARADQDPTPSPISGLW